MLCVALSRRRFRRYRGCRPVGAYGAGEFNNLVLLAISDDAVLKRLKAAKDLYWYLRSGKYHAAVAGLGVALGWLHKCGEQGKLLGGLSRLNQLGIVGARHRLRLDSRLNSPGFSASIELRCINVSDTERGQPRRLTPRLQLLPQPARPPT
jgi:hypothetical protein